MNGEADSSGQETVYWVNRFSERSVRKILESFRIVKPNVQDALTVISAEHIDRLEDEQLRESLNRQLQSMRADAWTIELPVVHMPSKQFSHSYDVLTKTSADAIHKRINSARKP